MVKSAAASVMVLFLQPVFMRPSRVFVERFLEALNETLMKLPGNPGNGISNNCKRKAAGTISFLSCRLSVLLNEWWDVLEHLTFVSNSHLDVT